MLQRVRSILQYGTISAILFIFEVLLVGYLLDGFWRGNNVWHNVILGLIALNLALLTVLGFQVIAHQQRNRHAPSEAELEAWTEHWLGLIWDANGEPRLNGVHAARVDAATDALLRLRERLRGEDSYKAAQWYDRSGLLERDLNIIWHGNKDERLIALDNLARARHPASLHALERLYKDADPETKRLALLALARVCARLKRPREQLVQRFYQKLIDPSLSRGMIERALVLLERNASPVLEALLEPMPVPHAHVQSALHALGHVRALELLDLCTYWLRDPNLSIRCAAARAMYQLGVVPLAAETPLRSMLHEENFAARAQAVLALSCLDRQFVNQVLLRCLGDSHWWVRHNSAVALSKRGKAGVALLERAALHHSDGFARDTARQQLIELGIGMPDAVLT